jgi:hypothetical protein
MWEWVINTCLISAKSSPKRILYVSMSGGKSIRILSPIIAPLRPRIFLPPASCARRHTSHWQNNAGIPSAAAVPKYLKIIRSLLITPLPLLVQASKTYTAQRGEDGIPLKESIRRLFIYYQPARMLKEQITKEFSERLYRLMRYSTDAI